jgi:hypothetical protein
MPTTAPRPSYVNHDDPPRGYAFPPAPPQGAIEDTRIPRPVSPRRGELRDAFLNNHSEARGHYDRVANIALMTAALASGIENELTQLRETLNEVKWSRGERESMYRRAGQVPPEDAYTEFDRQIAELTGRIKTLQGTRLELPKSQMESLDNFCSQNSKFLFREIDPAEFDTGKSVTDVWQMSAAVEQKRQKIAMANLTSDEAEDRIRALVRTRAEGGEVFFHDVLAREGGLKFPELQVAQMPGGGFEYVTTEDTLGLMLWLNGVDDFADKLVAKMREYNSQFEQMSEADCKAAFAANDTERLVAARQLECAIRKDELQGKRHKRPKNQAAFVTLWLDIDSRKPAPDFG